MSHGLVRGMIVPAAAGGGAGLTNINISAGTTSNLLSAVTFSNSNGVSFGLNASTITGSHNGLTSQSNQNVTAANGGFAFQTLSFSNTQGVSFATSAGSAIVASVAAQSNQQMTMFATGNTTLSSTGTSNASSLIFRGSGAASVGITGGSVLIDVAAGAAAITQSIGMSTQTAGGGTAGTAGYATGDDILYHFVAGSNITLSQSLNGASATLSIYGTSGGGGGAVTIAGFNNLVPAGDSANEPHRTFGFTAVPRTIDVYPLVLAPFCGPFPGDLTCNTFYFRMFLSGSTATMSQSHSSSFYIGIYTLNASTLSLLNSASTSFGSGAAATNLSTLFAGHRYLTLGTGAWSSSPVFRAGSVYWLATMHGTSNVSNQTGLFLGAGYIWASNSQSHSGTIGVATGTGTTKGLLPWVGRYGTTSTALPVSIGSNQLNKQVNNVVVPFVFLNQDMPASF